MSAVPCAMPVTEIVAYYRWAAGEDVRAFTLREFVNYMLFLDSEFIAFYREQEQQKKPAK